MTLVSHDIYTPSVPYCWSLRKRAYEGSLIPGDQQSGVEGVYASLQFLCDVFYLFQNYSYAELVEANPYFEHMYMEIPRCSTWGGPLHVSFSWRRQVWPYILPAAAGMLGKKTENREPNRKSRELELRKSVPVQSLISKN
jgi:hypothetical protein